MLTPEQSEQLEQVSGTTRVICIALIAGVVILAAIVCLQVDWETVHSQIETFSLVGAAIGLAIIAKSTVVPYFIAVSAINSARQNTTWGSSERLFKLGQAWQTETIVRFALLEGGALLNVIMFLMGKSIIPLAISAALLVFMFLLIPGTFSAADWVSKNMDE